MNGRVVASKAINGGFFVSSRYCNKEPSVPCPATYGVMEVTRRFNRYFINNTNNNNNNNKKKKKKKKKKKINIFTIIIDLDQLLITEPQYRF